MAPFAFIEAVYAVDYEDQETMWVVGSKDASLLHGHLRVAGRQIHFRPESVFRPHTSPFPLYTIYATMRHLADPIPLPLDPRFPALSQDNILSLRQALPFVVGIRIFQYGEAEIICNGEPNQVLSEQEWPLTIGGLSYFVTKQEPSRTMPSAASHVIPYGAKVCSGAHQSGACLGMKIVGPDGESAVTAVTHAFVHHPPVHSRSLSQKLVDAFLAVPWLLRQSLGFFIPKRFDVPSPTQLLSLADLPITTASQWASKMQVPLLGIEVFTTCVDDCSRKRADIGVVSDVFDFPLATQGYPAGYAHDLCLIRGSELPDVVALPLLPRLEKFIPYEEAFHMRDKALFTVTYPFIGGEKSEIRGLLLTGRTLDITTRECLLAGAQTMFGDGNENLAKLSEALLWRTNTKYRIKRREESPHDAVVLSNPISNNGDYLSATGYSGSVLLCVGSDAASNTTPIPAIAKVLGFQNFETALPETYANPAASALPSSLLTYKGAFRLPDYVYASTISMPGGIQTSVSAQQEMVLRQHLTRRRSHSL
ncbi:hypothetical protein FB451DRAFT_1262974 [Mycena latifolia]|nr:hypothetical protein FB451DRAFT_1262974 [Mycena latifolia]